MSRTPAPAKTSASASVETVAGPFPPASRRRATSTDFAVFRWGRKVTPNQAAWAARRSILRIIFSSSRTRQGVGRAAIRGSGIGGPLGDRRRQSFKLTFPPASAGVPVMEQHYPEPPDHPALGHEGSEALGLG